MFQYKSSEVDNTIVQSTVNLVTTLLSIRLTNLVLDLTFAGKLL